MEFHEYFTVQCDLQFTLRVKPGHSRERKMTPRQQREMLIYKSHFVYVSRKVLCLRETPYFAQDYVPVFSIKKILLGELKPQTSVFLR